MKKTGIIIIFISVISCSSTPAPSWQANAFNQMENYVATYMEGKVELSMRHYRKFYESLSLTADPDVIVKAPLVKCGVEFSVLKETECNGVREFIPAIWNKENMEYYRLVTSKNKLSEMSGKYKQVVQAVFQCDVSSVNKAVSGVEKGLSTLIAASYAVKHNCYNEETLLQALSVSSDNGWITASKAYLTELESFYKKSGQNSKAEDVAKRMELISK